MDLLNAEEWLEVIERGYENAPKYRDLGIAWENQVNSKIAITYNNIKGKGYLVCRRQMCKFDYIAKWRNLVLEVPFK